MCDRIFAACDLAEVAAKEKEQILRTRGPEYGDVTPLFFSDFKYRSVTYVGEGNKVVMYIGMVYYLFRNGLVDEDTHVFGSSMGSMIAA